MIMADKLRAPCPCVAMRSDQGGGVELELPSGIGRGITARPRVLNGVTRPEQQTANLDGRRCGSVCGNLLHCSA